MRLAMVFFRGKIVAVVGGGDTALEESIYLSKICKKVHLIVRKGKLRASKYLEKSAIKVLNLEIHFFNEIKEVLGREDVEGILLINKETSKETILSIEGIFIAIGNKPNTSIFKNKIQINENGYIKTKNGSSHTNIPGIFASGDVQDAIYRQAITAAASGVMAALDLDKYLLSIKDIKEK